MSNIKGMDELLATLSGLGVSCKEATRQGLHLAAKRIQGNAKLLTPVRTGQLRNSIKTKSEIIFGGAKAQVFTNLEYAQPVEFGTGARGASSHVRKPDGGNISYKYRWMGQRAQPYMTPAFLHARDNGTIEKDLILSLQKQIKKMESGKK